METNRKAIVKLRQFEQRYIKTIHVWRYYKQWNNCCFQRRLPVCFCKLTISYCWHSFGGFRKEMSKSLSSEPQLTTGAYSAFFEGSWEIRVSDKNGKSSSVYSILFYSILLLNLLHEHLYNCINLLILCQPYHLHYHHHIRHVLFLIFLFVLIYNNISTLFSVITILIFWKIMTTVLAIIIAVVVIISIIKTIILHSNFPRHCSS